VFASSNNGGRVGAFEGVAFMDECYPGVGARGRMWRARPRSMLAIAAERQALRRAFPSETGGLADVDEGEQPTPASVVVERASATESAALAEEDTRTGEVVQEPLNRVQLRERWGLLTGKARDLGVEYDPMKQSVSDAEALAAVEDLERRVRAAETSVVAQEGLIS
jgi:hypothetical protein